jgi:hypothetical protein
MLVIGPDDGLYRWLLNGGLVPSQGGLMPFHGSLTQLQ